MEEAQRLVGVRELDLANYGPVSVVDRINVVQGLRTSAGKAFFSFSLFSLHHFLFHLHFFLALYQKMRIPRAYTFYFELKLLKIFSIPLPHHLCQLPIV